MKALVKNAADREQVEDAEKSEQRRRERELADIYSILQTPGGRRFVWRYLGLCNVFKTSFNHSGSITAFNEGSRNIGLMLLDDVNEASPDSLTVMMKEAKEQRNV